ncbi:MAG: VWA domain-containing protein [Acidobacteriota bacterium]
MILAARSRRRAFNARIGEMGRRLFLALLVASVAALAIGAERVEGRVMIVLDASGSMWAPVEGKPKIAIARQAIADMLQGWDPAIEVGLMAYGHRRKGDCADIEVLVPPGPVDAARIARAADAIQPSGMTPLSAAVRRAAEELRWSEERATVILVSDGIETCKADPCEVGAELARMGVAFRAHVIGFDVPQKDEGGLRCLARTTGGLYLAARNAAALNTALRAARQEASAPPSVNVAPSPAKPASPPPPASVNADPAVVAGSQISVRWTGPNEPGDVVGFASPGAGSAGQNAVDVAAETPLCCRAPRSRDATRSSTSR